MKSNWRCFQWVHRNSGWLKSKNLKGLTQRMKKGKFIISMLTTATLVLTSAFAVSAVDTEETGSGFPIVQEEIPVSTDHVIPDADPNFEEMTLEEFQELYPDYEGVFSEEETGISPLYDGIEDPGYVTAKYDPPFEWVKEGDKWYLYSGTGTARQKVTSGGWYQDGNYWYCLYPNNATKYDGSTAHGEMITGWEKIRGYWYYFNEYGQMTTYWRQISGVYYYFSPSGADAIPGYPEGAMITGEHYLPYTKGSSRYLNYYFSSSGAMQDWSYPLPSGYTTVTSPFHDPGNGNHHGIDFSAPQGTYIFAATNGEVRYAGYNDSMGYALILESDVLDANGNYLYTRYMHMNTSPAISPFNFSDGDSVSVGDHIGYVGSTGNSSGFHLHFDVNANNMANTTLTVDDAINPICFFSTKNFTNTSGSPLYWDRNGEG